MKYYNIKLPHSKTGYEYPPNYEDTIGVFNQGHTYYTDETDKMFSLLIAIPDENALTTLPANVTEVTEAQAFAIANQHDPKVPTITNEAVVRILEIKSNLGITLSQKELDALDPAKGEPGFGLSENMVDIVTKSKNVKA